MNTRNTKQRDRLKALLKELFQLDKPELDFGLYKIMHAKSQQITQFLDTDLLKEIEAAFGAESAGRVQHAELKVAEAIEQAKSFGAADPEATPPVMQARAAYKLALEGGNTEAEIYDHLYRFFERYYDNGDFLSKRYYARENDSRAAPYSVPYDGREVYLHWANKDQYYIKSGEYLNNFSFDLTEAVRLTREAKGQAATALDFGDATTDGQPLKVHMHLAQAQEGEHGNIKAAADQKREFIPLLSNPVAFNEQGELVLNFEYKVLPEGYPIDAATEAALKTQYDFKNKGDVPAHWMADVFLRALQTLEKADTRYLPLLAEPVPTDTQKKRPLLAKYIQQYTARNTMDYFIHKDLGGFLRRELDFYIKNELMRLDDIEKADAPRVEDYLGKIKALRRIAHQLIAFLAQLEDFQKKLWLKKKFVTETQYCITLDRVPESLYPAIAANDAQREEWVKLFAIDEIASDTAQVGYSVPLTVNFLKQNSYLIVDTVFYGELFKSELIESIESVDLKFDGIILHSDNFQALKFISTKINGQVKCIYIDPPYNTGDDGFVYKDNYSHSSWACMMHDRLIAAKNTLLNNGWIFISIDEREYHRLISLIENIYGKNVVSTITIKMSHLSGMKMANLDRKPPKIKEYLVMVAANTEVSRICPEFERADWWEIFERYTSYLIPDPQNPSDCSAWKRENIKTAALRDGIDVDKYESFEKWAIENSGKIFRTATNDSIDIKETPRDNKFREIVTPTGLKKWVFNKEEVLFAKNFLREIDGKFVPARVLSDIWLDVGINNLHNEGGVEFKNGKKPIKLIERIIKLAGANNDFVLDFFAGSGSTAHGVLSLNNKYRLSNKFLCIEQDAVNFDKKLRARIQRVIYSSSWSLSKTNSRNGFSASFKYLRLESYEDTLNNLSLQSDPARERALADNPALRKDYVLKYWLNVETQGSQSLLNVSAFRDPTAYTMRIKQPGSDVLREQRIDLIETFNWLIGLWVEHMAAPQTLEAEFTREVDPVLPKDQNTRLVCKRIKHAESGPYWFRLVEGYTLKVPGDDSSRQKTLVVWRKLTDDAEKDNAVLQHFLMEKLSISPREHTYAVIYVNGSHTLPNPVVEGEQTKVRLIEEAFHAAMWSQDGV